MLVSHSTDVGAKIKETWDAFDMPVKIELYASHNYRYLVRILFDSMKSWRRELFLVLMFLHRMSVHYRHG